MDIVRDYLTILYDTLDRSLSYSYLDAEIINRKIYNIQRKLKIDKENNFDTIRYYKEEDSIMLDSVFSLFENYIKLDIYKLTGITYTEFKNMTVMERNLFMEYLIYKNELSDIEYNDVKESMDKKENENTKLYKY